jgi:hypothetical protein
LKQKKENLKNIVPTEILECTFSPKIQKTNSSNTNIEEEQNLKVGERLYSYQDKYKKNVEAMKDQYKESYTFKPQISKNTDEILKNREIALEEVRNKYSVHENNRGSPHNKNNNKLRVSGGSSNSPQHRYDRIEEVRDEDNDNYEDYKPKDTNDHDLTKYYKKLESRLNE